MTFALVALTTGVGRVEPDGSVAVLDVPHPSLAAFLRDAGPHVDAVRLPVRSVTEHPDAAPVAGPGSAVWGVGLNYRSKQLATGRPAPDEPVLFSKVPGAVVGPDSVLGLPRASECVDYEGEIAVVLAGTLFEATPAQARAAIGGIAAANDITARDVMRRTGNPAVAKNFPGFAPMGAVMIDLEQAGGLDGITLQTTVDGVVRQSDRSDGLLFGLPDLLAFLSRFTVLRPGDVVLTGTPAGTGDEDQRYLRPGTTIEVAVAELPLLRTTVVDAAREAAA